MKKFKISLPLRMADLRESMLKLLQEVSLMKSAYRQAGATSAQGQMILELDRSGPMPVLGLTSLLMLDKSTVSQTLAQIQKLGWVNVTENSRDRRFKTVTLTDTGRATVAAIQAGFDEQLTQVLKDCDPSQMNAIAFGVGLFGEVLESLRKPAAKADPIKQEQPLTPEASLPMLQP